MAGLSLYLSNKLIDHVNGHAVYTPPDHLWLALFTSDPTDLFTGTEVAGGSYARIEVTSDLAAVAAAAHAAANTGTYTFTDLPACVLTHGALFDAAVAGNGLYFGPLAGEPVTIASGGDYTLAPGDISTQMH